MGERGRYQTRQKEIIADFFSARPDQCLTADAVYSALDADVGMTTVYRAVARLCEEGFLRRFAPRAPGDAALYQLNRCAEHHMHIRCVDCGVLAHLQCGEVEVFSRHLLLQHGFVLDECSTVLYGRCEQCEAARCAPPQGEAHEPDTH
jgi:Fur family ferric uptake transcriptional regulator